MPVSLLAHITDTMAVSGRIDLSSSCRSSAPSGAIGRNVTVKPRFWRRSQNLMFAECSTAVVSTCRFSGCVTRALWIAELLLSVPQLVKTISLGSALRSELDVRRVLDGGGEHVPFLRLRNQGAVDRRVVAFRAATGKDDLPGLRVEIGT